MQKITKKMWFSSNIIAKQLGVELVQPIVDSEFVEFVLSIPKELKIADFRVGNDVFMVYVPL